MVEITSQNSTGMSDGVWSASGANVRNLDIWKRDKASLIQFCAPGMWTALHWMLLHIVNKTSGRSSCITCFDLDVLLFIIVTRTSLSMNISNLLFLKCDFYVIKANNTGTNSKNESSNINPLLPQLKGHLICTHWPPKYAAHPRWELPELSVCRDNLSLVIQRFWGT